MNRTRADTVTFARPFMLAKIDRELPAGTYPIETDEEVVEGASTTIYRRVEVRLFVPRIEGLTEAQMWTIGPNDFDKAVALDREPSAPRVSAPAPVPNLATRTAAFEKHRDQAIHDRSLRRDTPLFGACAGIVGLLFATWVANQV